MAVSATLRVVVHGFLDKRPRFGGADASDLCALMFSHYALRGYGHWQLSSLVESIQYKPPLWYVGVAGLFAPAASLSYGPLLLTGALALALALWSTWRFAVHLGTPRAGLLGVFLLTCMPAVAGRVTILGVEPWHMAMTGGMLLGLLRLRQARSSRRDVLALGGVVGAAMLMKWTFVALVIGPALLEGYAAIRGGDGTRDWRRRLAAAAAVAGGLFALWFVPFARIDRLLGGASDAPTHGALMSADSLLVFPMWMAQGLGVAGCFLTALAVYGATRGRAWTLPAPTLGCRPTYLLLASAAGLLLVHWIVPHKEPRYLLPAAWCLAMLLALGLDLMWQQGRLGKLLVGAGCLGLAASCYLLPVLLPGPPDDILRSQRLRLVPDPSDHGLDALVRHESLQSPGPKFVLFSLEGARANELLTMINWELYGRNDQPIISLPSVVPLDGESPTLWYGGQRWGATHLISNRDLPPNERTLLKERGFALTTTVDLPLPGPSPWSLWSR